jgi:hypothetical protein
MSLLSPALLALFLRSLLDFTGFFFSSLSCGSFSFASRPLQLVQHSSLALMWPSAASSTITIRVKNANVIIKCFPLLLKFTLAAELLPRSSKAIEQSADGSLDLAASQLDCLASSASASYEG